MGIRIERKEIVTVKDDLENALGKGDPIMIRMQGQDVVCRFMGMKNGYFVTETLDGANENKYRAGSIEACKRISGIREWPEIEAKKEA